jgi:hypothetical protein
VGVSVSFPTETFTEGIGLKARFGRIETQLRDVTDFWDSEQLSSPALNLRSTYCAKAKELVDGATSGFLRD